MSAHLRPTPVEPLRTSHWVSDSHDRGGIVVTFERGDALLLDGTVDEMRALLGQVGREVASLERELADRRKGSDDAALPLVSDLPGPTVETPNLTPPLPPHMAPARPRPSWSGLLRARTFDAGRTS